MIWKVSAPLCVVAPKMTVGRAWALAAPWKGAGQGDNPGFSTNPSTSWCSGFQWPCQLPLSSPFSCFSHREDIFLWAQVFIKSGTRKDSIWWAFNFSYVQLPSFHHLPSPTDIWLWSFCKNLRLLPRHSACGILLPRPRIGPTPPAVGAQSPNYWTTREVPANSSTALSSTQ